MKVAAHKKKNELAKVMGDTGAFAGEIPTFHIGHEEMLEIANAAHECMELENAEKDIVVKAARRNGMLVYRPD